MLFLIFAFHPFSSGFSQKTPPFILSYILLKLVFLCKLPLLTVVINSKANSAHYYCWRPKWVSLLCQGSCVSHDVFMGSLVAKCTYIMLGGGGVISNHFVLISMKLMNRVDECPQRGVASQITSPRQLSDLPQMIYTSVASCHNEDSIKNAFDNC